MSHGGTRPGAGRPAKPKVPPLPAFTDPLDFLRAVMNSAHETTARRLRAATALAMYVHAKAGAAGKKDERAEAAKKAATGKFRPAAPPIQLVPR